MEGRRRWRSSSPRRRSCERGSCRSRCSGDCRTRRRPCSRRGATPRSRPHSWSSADPAADWRCSTTCARCRARPAGCHRRCRRRGRPSNRRLGNRRHRRVVRHAIVERQRRLGRQLGHHAERRPIDARGAVAERGPGVAAIDAIATSASSRHRWSSGRGVRSGPEHPSWPAPSRSPSLARARWPSPTCPSCAGPQCSPSGRPAGCRRARA